MGKIIAQCRNLYLPTPTAVARVGFSPAFVCVCVFFIRTVSQKPLHQASLNLTQKCSTTSPGNSFILGEKFKGEGHEAQNSAGVGLCTLVSSGFF